MTKKKNNPCVPIFPRTDPKKMTKQEKKKKKKKKKKKNQRKRHQFHLTNENYVLVIFPRDFWTQFER